MTTPTSSPSSDRRRGSKFLAWGVLAAAGAGLVALNVGGGDIASAATSTLTGSGPQTGVECTSSGTYAFIDWTLAEDAPKPETLKVFVREGEIGSAIPEGAPWHEIEKDAHEDGVRQPFSIRDASVAYMGDESENNGSWLNDIPGVQTAKDWLDPDAAKERDAAMHDQMDSFMKGDLDISAFGPVTHKRTLALEKAVLSPQVQDIDIEVRGADGKVVQHAEYRPGNYFAPCTVK